MSKKLNPSRIVLSVCAGDSCSDKKSKKLRTQLKRLVAEQRLEEIVRVKKCSCRGECSDAPVVEVKPGEKCVKDLHPKAAAQLLEEVLAGKHQKK